jgi:prepilin-type N-terminal cleavage/methylation domain-containing protein
MTASRTHKRGFTLVEMLVAVALITTITTAVVAMLIAALRVTKKGAQSIQGYELARGAFNQIERDLTVAFTARDFGQSNQFFGTPMGMTFVGVGENAVNPDAVTKAESGKLCRITWVLYQERSGQFDLEDRNDVNRNPFRPPGVLTYSLLRFVELGTGDIDNFRVLVAPGYATGNNSQYVSLEQFVNIAANELGAPAMQQFLTANESALLNLGMEHEAIKQMRLREIWVRLLAGDPIMTNDGTVTFWGDGTLLDNRPAIRDYVVAENILLPGATNQQVSIEWGTNRVDDDGDFIADPLDVDECPGFFQYGMMRSGASLPVLLQYWQSELNLDNVITPTIDGLLESDRIGSPVSPRIPEVVHVTLGFGMASPFPGSPDFLPTPFQQTIELPSGYVRTSVE